VHARIQCAQLPQRERFEDKHPGYLPCHFGVPKVIDHVPVARAFLHKNSKGVCALLLTPRAHHCCQGRLHGLKQQPLLISNQKDLFWAKIVSNKRLGADFVQKRASVCGIMDHPVYAT